jgi:LPPG:FO 2-phospho-L-lactate transferase
LVIAPSNPLISIDPMLQVPGVREVLRARREDVVAVSPLVAGAALKGPADRLLRELGHDATTLGVVDFYEGLVGTWVIDEADVELSEAITSRGVAVEVTTTIMADPQNARRLAKVVLG